MITLYVDCVRNSSWRIEAAHPANNHRRNRPKQDNDHAYMTYSEQHKLVFHGTHKHELVSYGANKHKLVLDGTSQHKLCLIIT